MLLHELQVTAGRAPTHFMETVCTTGLAATTSWFVFFFFADKTFLETAHVPVTAKTHTALEKWDVALEAKGMERERERESDMSQHQSGGGVLQERRFVFYKVMYQLLGVPALGAPRDWPCLLLVNGASIGQVAFYDIVNLKIPYKQVWLAEAALIGVLGGLIGLLTLVLMGLFRQIGAQLLLRLGPRRGTLLLPALGGLIIGLLGMAFPLTFGDGSLQLNSIVQSLTGDGGSQPLPRDYLIGTMFAKMLTLSVSLGFGFVGGQIFPCIFIGACAGVVATIVSGVPSVVTVPCFMAAVPGAFCPIPFTLACLVSISFVLGPDLTTLVFTSVFFSFMTACGTGVIQRIMKRGGERQARQALKHAAKVAQKAALVQERLRALESENRLLRRISTEAGVAPEVLLRRGVSAAPSAYGSSGGELHRQKSSAPRAGSLVALNHKSPYL